MGQESTVFVGNLEFASSVETLEPLLVELFSQCGKVTSVRLPSEGSKTKGFAFIEMSSKAAATYATLALNGLRFHGRCIRVACAMDDEKDVQIRLENLPSTWTEVDLYESLSRKVTDLQGIWIKRNHVGRSEGKATVWFSTRAAADSAKNTLFQQPLFLDSLALKISC